MAVVGAFLVGASLACGGGGPKEAGSFTGPHTSTIVDVDAAGKLLVTVGEDRHVHVWSWPDLEGVRTLALDDYGTAVALSSDGGRLAVAGRKQEVEVWNTASWTREAVLDHEAGALAWEGDRLALAHPTDGTVAIYTASDLSFVGLLEGHTAAVVDVAFASDGLSLATASKDRTARVWEVATGQVRQVYVGHRAGVVAVEFSPDGALLATGSQDKTARLWDVPSGEPVRQVSGHRDWVVGLAFPETPGKLVTAGKDGRYRVWSVTDGASLEKVEQDGGFEDALFIGDQLVLVGEDIFVRDVDDALALETNDARPLELPDPRCERLIGCGKALVQLSDRAMAERGLQIVRTAREIRSADAEVCLTSLLAVPSTLEGEAPAACLPR